MGVGRWEVVREEERVGGEQTGERLIDTCYVGRLSPFLFVFLPVYISIYLYLSTCQLETAEFHELRKHAKLNWS